MWSFSNKKGCSHNWNLSHESFKCIQPQNLSNQSHTKSKTELVFSAFTYLHLRWLHVHLMHNYTTRHFYWFRSAQTPRIITRSLKLFSVPIRIMFHGVTRTICDFLPLTSAIFDDAVDLLSWPKIPVTIFNTESATHSKMQVKPMR